MIYLCILLNVGLLVSGQICFKWGLAPAAGRAGANAVAAIALNPWIWTGLALYVVATAVWFYVLARAPLSVAYPLQSLSYLLGLFASRFVLHEPVPWTRWMGVCIILAGVALVAYIPRTGA
ncbi:MAG: EamA family transporter [Alicyclobacillaceae bacterium]|nr:EamA family transporter [Alicyclobacillaceae bacterium]